MVQRQGTVRCHHEKKRHDKTRPGQGIRIRTHTPMHTCIHAYIHGTCTVCIRSDHFRPFIPVPTRENEKSDETDGLHEVSHVKREGERKKREERTFI